MKRFIIILVSVFTFFITQAQDTLKEKSLDEVIIYSSKFAERKKNIVQKIDILTSKQIAQTNAQNTGDLLVNTGNVFVQKSQQGGSSPVIRGFEASRVLLVIDGIRMNNAIYRSGHLQNIITVDQNMLEQVEVLYGPASTLFGSDALGGVVHLKTKSPKLSTTGKTLWKGAAFVRYSSANKENSAHIDVSMGGKKIGWLQSYNYSDFDDLRMGDNYPSAYPDFGRRSQYITTINGIDSIINNSDDRIQKFSGYSQWDITQKFIYNQSEKISHQLNLQYSTSSDVPRYDRLQDIRNGRLRWAEWYYGPQDRQLASYEFNISTNGFFNNIRSLLAYQHIEESRHQREYRRYDRLDNRFEKLNVYSINLDARRIWANDELTVGLDGQFNDVTSTAFRKSLLTGETSPIDTRYPDGKNNMNYYGVYAQHIHKFMEGKLVLNDGLRLQAVTLHSQIKDNSFFAFPFTQIESENLALTGNLGLIYMPDRNLRVNAGFSSGFRAPNIDDASKIFESNSASRQLIVPNPGIDPEYTYNIDLGFTQTIAEKLRFEVTGFHTWFRNAITLSPFQLDGHDSVLYNGSLVQVYASQNVNKATLYGFNAAFTFDVNMLRFYSSINYTYGRLKNQNKTQVPLDHIPPVFGKTSLAYNAPKFQAEIYSLYNGWKRIKDYNPSGEDNAQYATPDGTPSWFTMNLKTSVSLSKYLTLQAGIENILDRNYRYFASGFSAPGRNVIIALRATF